MSTPFSSTDTVTVSVSMLSTVLAAAIHQATETALSPCSVPESSPLSAACDQPSGSGIARSSR